MPNSMAILHVKPKQNKDRQPPIYVFYFVSFYYTRCRLYSKGTPTRLELNICGIISEVYGGTVDFLGKNETSDVDF